MVSSDDDENVNKEDAKENSSKEGKQDDSLQSIRLFGEFFYAVFCAFV